MQSVSGNVKNRATLNSAMPDGSVRQQASPSHSLCHIRLSPLHEILPLKACEPIRIVRFVFVQIWRKHSVFCCQYCAKLTSRRLFSAHAFSTGKKEFCLCAHRCCCCCCRTHFSQYLFVQLFFSSLLFYFDGKCCSSTSPSVCKFRVRETEAVIDKTRAQIKKRKKNYLSLENSENINNFVSNRFGLCPYRWPRLCCECWFLFSTSIW